MAILFYLTICATYLIGTTSAHIVKYTNFTLYQIIPKNVDGLNALKNLEEYNEYDFWTGIRGVGFPIDVLSAPNKVEKLNDLIDKHEMDYKILSKNIQEQIDQERNFVSLNRASIGIDWTNYHRVNEIYDWLRLLAQQYPNTVTLIAGGLSYEGRQILGVKVSFRKGNEKRGVWLDSLIHAREWITAATNTYILNELLTSSNPDVRRIAESHDWYFLPVLNPDGYEFSWNSNRLWRKTRKPYGIICFGADPNRNWGYRWNTGGSSTVPCLDTYAGAKAFSEIETQTLSQFITTVAPDLKVFISLHSYSQKLLLPYGHTADRLDNYYEVREISLVGAKALAKRYGTLYEVGNIVEEMYVATGSSADWVKATFQVPVVITFELRDTGTNGFILPPEQIIPTGEETLDSLIAILDETDRLYPDSQ